LSQRTQTIEREAFWQGSLGYPHAVVLIAFLIAVSVALHATIGYKLPVSANPVLWLMALVVPASLVAGRVGRKDRVIHWLTGIPVAVTITAAVGILALIGGIVPARIFQERFHVESMWVSWPFLLTVDLMLVNLVGSVGKRCWPLNYTNIVYLASHAGLAIAIIGGACSSLFLERDVIPLFPGKPTNRAIRADGSSNALPFTLELKEFILESFPPTLAVAKLDAAAEGGMSIDPGEDFMKKGLHTKVGVYQVEVLDFIPKAILTPQGWRAAPWKTAAPAVHIAVHLPGGSTTKGWVSSGAMDAPQSHLKIDDTIAIVMPEPRPKEFRSHVTVKEGGTARDETIKVNSPITRGGWTLYQLSYDADAGAASQYSTIEAVRDPGIGFVYFGMGLMVLGSCLHLWSGVSSTGGKS